VHALAVIVGTLDVAYLVVLSLRRMSVEHPSAHAAAL
jgi:hypothetical protein